MFVDKTNLDLLRQVRSPFKDMAGALRFLGVVRLETCFEFSKLDKLWSTVGRKYIAAVEFGKTLMGHYRFNEIFSAYRYTKNFHTVLQI